ncbi:SDR family oxidoreductase [Nocardia sp. NBC_01327]|uniref:SDR family oxidoreductase n=1 Tax=Nocardia sp. NBC_01327 TaxID=2903593 RepID=UPI002E1103E1|nr:SDR family oxidoreductase [Nocardia sp. NBC_01327]
MSTKIALVTGANKGLGRETARRLAATGMTVLIGARDRTRGAAAAAELAVDGMDVRFVPLDVTDADSVKAAAAYIQETFGKLDVLVNNAGISVENRTPVTEVTADLMRRTFETNVFGVVTVTNTMLPLLRESESAGVVNVSSMLGSLALSADPEGPFAQWPGAFLLAYNSSKTALNALTVMWANVLRAEGIKVNSADPGYVATDLNHHSGSATVEQGAEAIVALATLGVDGPTGTFQGNESQRPW